jgi:hypothetical protein
LNFIKFIKKYKLQNFLYIFIPFLVAKIIDIYKVIVTVIRYIIWINPKTHKNK